MFEQTLFRMLTHPLDKEYYERLRILAPLDELYAMIESRPVVQAFLDALMGCQPNLCPNDRPPASIPSLLARARIPLNGRIIYIIRSTGWCVDVYQYWDAIRRMGHLKFAQLDDVIWFNHLLLQGSHIDAGIAAFNNAVRELDVWTIYHEESAISYATQLFRNYSPEVVEMKKYDDSLRLSDVVIFTSAADHPFALAPAPDHIPSVSL